MCPGVSHNRNIPGKHFRRILNSHYSVPMKKIKPAQIDFCQSAGLHVYYTRETNQISPGLL